MDALTLAMALVTATAGEAVRIDPAPALRSATTSCFTLMAWTPDRIAAPQSRARVPARALRLLPRRLERPHTSPCFRLANG